MNRIEDEEGDVDHTEHLEKRIVIQEGAQYAACSNQEDDNGGNDIEGDGQGTIVGLGRHTLVNEVPEGGSRNLGGGQMGNGGAG